MDDHRARHLLCGLLLATLSLCWGCTDEIWASDYDQSCTVDEDCVLVFEGDYCDRNACHCGGGAINVDELEQWERDLAELYRCEARMTCDCVAYEAYCNDGRCATREM